MVQIGQDASGIPNTSGIIPLEEVLTAAYNLSDNATDITGGGLDGTVFGTNPVPDFEGTPNAAMEFDGTGDYITLANSREGFSYIHNTGVFSIAFWGRFDDLQANSPIGQDTQ